MKWSKEYPIFSFAETIAVAVADNLMNDNKTGKFGVYCDKENANLGYKRFLSRVAEIVSDGRDYLVWIRLSNASDGKPGQMFTSVERVKLSARIVLVNYTKAKIGEFTVMPSGDFACSDIEKFSSPDGDNYPIQIAKIGDIYLEKAGWVAPNLETAWLRISPDKYEEVND